MYSLEICQLVIVRVYTSAEEQPCVPPVYDLGHVAELDEIGLMFLVARRDQAVNLVCVVRDGLSVEAVGGD